MIAKRKRPPSDERRERFHNIICAENMRNEEHSFQPRPQSYDDFFGRPALNRRKRLERASLAMLDGRDVAYLEVRDVLDAYPEATSDVLEAIADHERAGRAGGLAA